MRLMFTALSINSMLIRTVIMLRRTMTPIRPTANNVPESIRYISVPGMAEALCTHGLLDFLLDLGTLEDVLRRRLFLFRRQFALADHDRANHCHEQEQRHDLERHEIRRIQRHAYCFRV